MGTLFDQKVRSKYSVETEQVKDFIEEIKSISEQTGLTIDQVLKAFEIKELERKNDLYITNGDIHDEQMAGFGELLKGLTSSIDALSERVDI